jgi:hypothetical protein
MRRCQRLPELRTPLIPRDAGDYIKGRTGAVCEKLQQNEAVFVIDRPKRWTP